MKKVHYVGPFDKVFVPAADQSCEWGKCIEVDDDVAESLLEQDSNWVARAPKKEKVS